MKRALPEGARVKFSHLRMVETNGWKLDDDPVTAKEIAEQGLTVLPRGGITHCKIILPNGVVVNALAECSNKDNYSKKLGREISLGRALAAAEVAHPELFNKEVTA